METLIKVMNSLCFELLMTSPHPPIPPSPSRASHPSHTHRTVCTIRVPSISCMGKLELTWWLDHIPTKFYRFKLPSHLSKSNITVEASDKARWEGKFGFQKDLLMSRRNNFSNKIWVQTGLWYTARESLHENLNSSPFSQNTIQKTWSHVMMRMSWYS